MAMTAKVGSLFKTQPRLPKRQIVTEANAVGRALVNLDQFPITTWTILAIERFGVGIVRPRPWRTKTDEI